MKKFTLLLIICALLVGCKKQETAIKAVITNSDINEFVHGYNKMEAALVTHYALRESTPNAGSDGAINVTPLYESGLRPADLNYKEYHHRLFVCNKTGINYPNAGICAVTEIPVSLACSMEVFKDDQNYNAGAGRIRNAPPFTSPCDLTDKTLVTYVYKLF